jgi:hypothetical protein
MIRCHHKNGCAVCCCQSVGHETGHGPGAAEGAAPLLWHTHVEECCHDSHIYAVEHKLPGNAAGTQATSKEYSIRTYMQADEHSEPHGTCVSCAEGNACVPPLGLCWPSNWRKPPTLKDTAFQGSYYQSSWCAEQLCGSIAGQLCKTVSTTALGVCRHTAGLPPTTKLDGRYA